MSSMYPSFGGAPTRPCARCGAPLTINETQCSRCGLYNPLPQQGQQFGAFQQGAPGAGPGPSGPLWGNQAPQGSPYQPSGNSGWLGNQDASASAWGSQNQAGGGWSQNAAFGGQGQMPPQQNNMFGSNMGSQNASPFANMGQNGNASAFNNNSFGNANFGQNAERPSMNSFFQATQQNGYGGGASPLAPNRPSWMQKPGEDDEDDDGKGKGKNRPGANVILVIIILVVALIGGGSYGGYYLYKHHNAATPANTPNTNGPVITTPSTTPLFSDNFKNNSNNWSTTPGKGGKITLAGNSKLVLEADTASVIVPAIVPGGKTFGDVRVDVNATLTSSDLGNGYGIYIRAATSEKNPLGLSYRFEVYGNGNFVIYKNYASGGKITSQSLKQSLQASDAIAHAGTVNHLTVIAKGQTLTFSVNGTPIANFTDATYTTGSVALFVSMVKTATSTAQASFQNLAIFPA